MVYLRLAILLFQGSGVAQGPKLDGLQHLNIEILLRFLVISSVSLEYEFTTTEGLAAEFGTADLVRNCVDEVGAVDQMCGLDISPFDQLVQDDQHMLPPF